MKNRSFNPVELWINTDSKLSAILVKLQELPSTLEKQAELAFHQIAETYSLPKMPYDIDYTIHNEEIRSVYEVLGLINYVFPNEDPRGNVMLALCCVKDNLPFGVDEVLAKAQENNINLINVSGIGFLGENYNVQIIFVGKDESWFDLGCNFFIKI